MYSLFYFALRRFVVKRACSRSSWASNVASLLSSSFDSVLFSDYSLGLFNVASRDDDVVKAAVALEAVDPEIWLVTCVRVSSPCHVYNTTV